MALVNVYAPGSRQAVIREIRVFLCPAQVEDPYHNWKFLCEREECPNEWLTVGSRTVWYGFCVRCGFRQDLASCADIETTETWNRYQDHALDAFAADGLCPTAKCRGFEERSDAWWYSTWLW